ncbi:DUF3052 domain-containing protein [Neomicrococcus aestuarii]|uniref:DUF3052 domain-containing protein n=1 Tax=Neomicrococcus aestuarii TaxID=556325 RepID=A0A1L2ZPY6_9MICC|nr:DUF3052 domain-containing protein [Neomicrococcus aestuarii]APF41209.1 DUF3052 domain-containing protein [Neomicrococcus aestuarii]
MTKTLAEKLQIKPSNQVQVLGAGPEELALLEPLPEGAEFVEGIESSVSDSAVIFARDKSQLDELFLPVREHLAGTRAGWVIYPKGNRSDINRDSIWRYMEDIDWTLNSNVSVDDFWSAVRFKKKA